MKKVFLLLFVSVLFTSFSFAQIKISGGPLAGVNFASASFDPAQSGATYKTLTGFGFGAILNLDFAQGIGVQVEPMYLQAGVKTTGTIALTGQNVEVKNKVNYLEIPILFTYTIATGKGQIQPYLLAGPSVGILLSAKFTDINGNETDVKSTTKSTNFSAMFGAGAKMPVGKNTVFLEARYSLGLSNVNDNPNNTTQTIKGRGVQIFAGITFPFGM